MQTVRGTYSRGPTGIWDGGLAVVWTLHPYHHRVVVYRGFQRCAAFNQHLIPLVLRACTCDASSRVHHTNRDCQRWPECLGHASNQQPRILGGPHDSLPQSWRFDPETQDDGDHFWHVFWKSKSKRRFLAISRSFVDRSRQEKKQGWLISSCVSGIRSNPQFDVK